MCTEVGPGAYLKRMSDDARAIVVDCVGSKYDCWIVAMATERFRSDDIPEKEKDCVPTKRGDYVFVEITNTDEWLVLDAGHGLMLIE